MLTKGMLNSSAASWIALLKVSKHWVHSFSMLFSRCLLIRGLYRSYTLMIVGLPLRRAKISLYMDIKFSMYDLYNSGVQSSGARVPSIQFLSPLLPQQNNTKEPVDSQLLMDIIDGACGMIKIGNTMVILINLFYDFNAEKGLFWKNS